MDVSSSDLIKLLHDRSDNKIDFLLIDVREYHEYEAGCIDGVDKILPLSLLSEWGEDFFNAHIDKKIIFTCRSGNRSGRLAQIFTHNGHKGAVNHIGGIISYGGKIKKGTYEDE